MPQEPQTLDPLLSKVPRPLYVDLDGTFVRTDTLWESIVELVRKKPFRALLLPFWVLGGKASFKRRVASEVVPETRSMPRRDEVVSLVKARREAGAKVYLATAADSAIAGSVLSDGEGLFDGVIGSDGRVNLASDNKLAAIQAHAGGEPFDYVGDSKADLKVFAGASTSFIAGGRREVVRAALFDAQKSPERRVVVLESSRNAPKTYLKAIRIHQWAKNALILIPLITSHRLFEADSVMRAVFAFFAFSFVASAVYLVNDLLDLPNDRIHPSKRKRPLAAGLVTIPTGFSLAALFFLSGILTAYIALGPAFTGMVLLYMVTTTLYSTVLKRKLVVDIMALAGLYTFRVMAGSIAIGVETSEWLLAFSMFIFTTLAMIKRYAELSAWSDLSARGSAGRSYTVTDMSLFLSVGPASAYAAVLVLALYVSSHDVKERYLEPRWLWLLCPVLLYWITRMWFLTNRTSGRKALEDPVLFALTDRASLFCAVVFIGIVGLAKFVAFP